MSPSGAVGETRLDKIFILGLGGSRQGCEGNWVFFLISPDRVLVLSQEVAVSVLIRPAVRRELAVGLKREEKELLAAVGLVNAGEVGLV